MKNSTLIYFVKSYQNDNDECEKLGLFGKESEVKSEHDNKTIFSPSAKSVNAILNFAKSYDVMHSKAVGCIEMIKN
ncbi:hypothetical protein ACUNWD_17995 [Sunxiuqinia sp. A32]|uniref:hypothetical protein n=1 Tax=Sunxiuqinia sp. A32 TaxID=3461496 RepID=UPI0040464978